MLGTFRTLAALEPGPRLNLIYPPGGQTGTSFGVRVSGSNSEEYAVLHRWIAQAAPPPNPDDPAVVRVSIDPVEAVLKPGTGLPNGRHPYGQGALLARRLVEAGSTCVTVNTGYWDHHDDIEKKLEQHLPPLDAAIATLVEDLDQRGMLDDVLIFCAGEFGRTPLINGHAGRDHWPNCFSVLFGGGGVQGGRIVGASEARGGDVRDRPVTPQDLLATIYKVLGIPLDLHFPDASGRPVSIVGTGKPILELF